ncbi:AAA family ATPase [Permianibacter sp. IMCC34836]|uniref:AAA family ATPase n=1 Tax=Permianibacter fluminis TaxID=2738515 RepID=UPI00155645FA|nr:AAA family ATPase [Permianibacter fluminis]NQD36298.1 AAA family ATPase [Permianibacter fluminis]
MANDSRFSSFHCATPALSQLEDELQHLCHYGRGLILVFGPPGAGRSHIAKRLKAQVSNTLPVALIQAQPLMTSAQIDQDALRQLGLTQIAMMESDLSLAIARAPAGRRTLIIDDAQDLNLHVLRSLLECAVSEREREDPRLTLVLFGDDMLETALAELDFAGLSPHDLHRLMLPAFSVDDAQRLATVWAAAQGENEPERSVVRAAWQQQQGWPGAILTQLAEQAVTNERDEYPDDEQDEFSSDVREHSVDDGEEAAGFWQRHSWLKLPLIGVGVFTLALALMYQRELNDWIKGGDKAATSASKPATEPGADLGDARRQDLAIDAQPVPTGEAPASLEIIEEPTGGADSVDAAGRGDAANVEANNETDSQYAANAGTDNTASDEFAPVKPESKTTESKPAISKPVPEPVKPTPSKPVADKPAEKPVSKPVNKPASNNDRYSADEQALLNASPGYFAVQIIGLRDDDSMAQFVRQHKLDRGLVYHGVRDGKPWQVLVLAPFADRAAAERARDALPEAVRKGGPWIKTIKAIQDEIKAKR